MPLKRIARPRIQPRRVWIGEGSWTVHLGQLERGRGRPEKVEALFSVVGEKLPFESLSSIARAVSEEGLSTQGVYVAHDSMGYARYVGRGDIFTRLRSRRRAHPAELHYFSFYVVANKKHEVEIETLLIRAAGPQLHFNSRKRRIDIQPGDVRDFEHGTVYFERQRRRGRKPNQLR